MKTKILMVNVEKLCSVEKFIVDNRRAINEDDTEILEILESVMEFYTYGWYICQQDFIEQLKELAKFKMFILYSV